MIGLPITTAETEPLASRRNNIDAVLHGHFVRDVGLAVGNQGEPEAGAIYLLAQAQKLLRSSGRRDWTKDAWEFANDDFDRLDHFWPSVQAACLEFSISSAPIARFVADRLPSVWSSPSFNRHPPVTRALVLAETSHDLAANWSVGRRASGSKDPFAMRRLAKHWLFQVVSPFTIGPLGTSK